MKHTGFAILRPRPVKLRWRALAVRHSFHVLPGESILDLGAGAVSGPSTWRPCFAGKLPSPAAVFNEDLWGPPRAGRFPTRPSCTSTDLARDLPAESFDYVVGTAILCHDAYGLNLKQIHRLLKPGGELLFFEANFWNPQVLVKGGVRALRRRLDTPPVR